MRSQAKHPGTAPDAEVLQELDSAALKATHLVQQMLSLARAEAGAGGQRESIDACALLQALGDKWRKAALAEHKSILIEPCATPSWVMADAQVLQDALNNLIENALKVSDVVEVEPRDVGNVLVISVADRGPGIPDAERERIFEPFYRPDGASPDQGRAGLGLAIARALANAPSLLLADEPTGRLDSRTGALVLDLLDRIRSERGTTLIVVSHDPRVAARADRVVSLLDGRVADGG